MNAIARKAPDIEPEDLHEEVVRRLNKDVAAAAASMSRDQARFVVALYYQIQRHRIQLNGQALAGGEKLPHGTLSFLFEQVATIERQCKKALDVWTDQHPTSRWVKTVRGIGPVLAAGLLAHIDLTERTDARNGNLSRPTVSRIWRFAGLDPTVRWGKGEKRPWNAKLKLISWKIGQSFMKVSNHPDSLYGKLYRARKAFEQQRSDAGECAEAAAAGAARVGKDTEAFRYYSEGKLPPGQIDGRARRYAVKIFLSHYFSVAYRHHYREEPPRPYAISVLGHADEIVAPTAGTEVLVAAAPALADPAAIWPAGVPTV